MSSGTLHRVTVFRTDVSENVPSPSLGVFGLIGFHSCFTLMKEAPDSSETSVLTRATRRNNPENTIILVERLFHYLHATYRTQWQIQFCSMFYFIFSLNSYSVTFSCGLNVFTRNIWGSRSGGFEKFCPLNYIAMRFIECRLKFRRNILLCCACHVHSGSYFIWLLPLPWIWRQHASHKPGWITSGYTAFYFQIAILRTVFTGTEVWIKYLNVD
jgi:hypothetical protein